MGKRKFGRPSDHRRTLLRNQVTQVVLHDRIETTEAKAKEIRPLVEEMITLGKRGDLHARRQAASFLVGSQAVKRLFEEIAPRYEDRAGGYTRLVKTGVRRGDAAPQSLVELV